NAVVGAKLFHCLAWQDSLGAVSEVDNWLVFWVLCTVSNQVWTQFQNLVCHFLGGQWWGCGFQNNELVTLKLRSNSLCGRVDVLHVDVVVLGEWSRYRNDVRICMNLLGSSAE